MHLPSLMGVITPFGNYVCMHFCALLMRVYGMLLRMVGLGWRLSNLLRIRQPLQRLMLIVKLIMLFFVVSNPMMRAFGMLLGMVGLGLRLPNLLGVR